MSDEFDHVTDVDPEYDPETDTYRVGHDFDGEGRLSLTIIVALERIADDDPDREPGSLFEAVEPDGLDALFSSGEPFPLRDRGELTFPTGDYEVTVRAHGRIEIRPLDES